MVKKKKQEINLNQSHSAKASRDHGKSPSNSRSITESVLAFLQSEKYVLSAALSGIFFFCLMLYSFVQLSLAIRTEQAVEAYHAKVISEKQHWETIVSERPEYRDGYFMLALIQYQLGEKDAAKKNVTKALEIDPNFKEGREMERMLQSN